MTTAPHPDDLPPLPESLCIDYVCEAAVKESRERYTLNTSRTAFQAGALFACRLALAQARPVPLRTVTYVCPVCAASLERQE